MNGLTRKRFAWDLKAETDGAGGFSGYGSVFHNVDDSWYNDVMVPGCFADCLTRFLQTGFVGGMNHDWDQPIGRCLEAREDAKGLFLSAKLSDTEHAREVRTLLQDGVVTRLSIGFRVLGREYLETESQVMAYWAKWGYQPTEQDRAKAVHGARLITRTELYEVSPVAVPANPLAEITSVKSSSGVPQTGLPLADHSGAVLAAVEEYLARVESVAERRAADGRGMSQDHAAGLRTLRARMETLLTRMGTPPDVTPAPTPAAATEAFLRFQALNARLAGVEMR